MRVSECVCVFVYILCTYSAVCVRHEYEQLCLLSQCSFEFYVLMMARSLLSRLRETVPWTKIIVMLRHPRLRAYSHWWMDFCKERTKKRVLLLSCFERELCIGLRWFSNSIFSFSTLPSSIVCTTVV